MFAAIWEFVKGLFGSKAVQIGKGNQVMTGSSTGANSPVISAGRDVHLVMHGAGAESPKTEKDELLEWMRQHAFREPIAQALAQLIRLAQIVGDADVEHWARLELFGYTRDGGMRERDVVPEYRAIIGEYYDDYDQVLKLPSKLHFVNQYRVRFGVATLEEWAKKTEMQNIADPGLIELIEKEFHVKVRRFCFNPIAVADVVNAIRNQMLERVRQLTK